MSRFAKLSTVVAVLLLLWAALAWRHYLHHTQALKEAAGKRQVPLQLLLHLDQGLSLTQRFEVDFKAAYTAEFEYQASTPMGTPSASYTERPTIELSVTSNNIVIAEENSAEFSRSNPSIGGSNLWTRPFEACPGAQYDLRLRVLQATPGVTNAQGRVQVAAAPLALKNMLVKSSVLSLKAICLTISAFLFLLPLVITVGRSLRSRNHST